MQVRELKAIFEGTQTILRHPNQFDLLSKFFLSHRRETHWYWTLLRALAILTACGTES